MNDREALIAKIAETALRIAFQAGVDATSIAGQIVSCLAKRPELIDRFMIEGTGLFLSGEITAGKGCLSYLAGDGNIYGPEVARRSDAVRQIKRDALNPR